MPPGETFEQIILFTQIYFPFFVLKQKQKGRLIQKNTCFTNTSGHKTSRKGKKMENRRQYNPNSTDNPFNRNKFQQRPNERPNQNRAFQPKEDRFRQGDEKSQPNDGRFQRRDSSSPIRGDKFQPKEGVFPRREGGFPRRDNNLQNRPNRFDPKKRFDSKAKPIEKEVSLPKVYSELQITDGKHRGKFFQSTTSPKYHPTSRRIRETLFKIISRRVRGKRFLELCAGSGAVGLDAISHGALLGTFVERSAKMCSFIKQNMTSLEIKVGHGEIFEIEVIPFLKRMAKRKRFWDVAFWNPPYDTNYDETLEYLSRGYCLKQHGMLIIEHHSEMFFPEKLGVLKRWRVVVEGDSALSFYQRS